MKLGKILAMAALFVLVSPLAQAAEGKLGIGAQGGWTFPDYHVKSGPVSEQFSNNNGWLAGAFLEFGAWGLLIRPEANYVTKGYSIANVGSVNNHYLDIPVLLKIAPLTDWVVSPFILIGPQWEKFLNSSVSTQAGTVTFPETTNRWDISALGGAGVDFNVSEHFALNVQGRYSYGFRNVSSTSTNIYMRGFYLLGGLTIQNPF